METVIDSEKSTTRNGNLCDSNGVPRSGYGHSFTEREDGYYGKLGASRWKVNPIPDPNKTEWEETDRLANGYKVGYDGDHWYLLNSDGKPNSEGFDAIYVTERGRVEGVRNNSRTVVSEVSPYEPKELPDGTIRSSDSDTDEDTVGEFYHSVFVEEKNGNYIICKTVGATKSEVKKAQEEISKPKCAPDDAFFKKTRHSPALWNPSTGREEGRVSIHMRGRNSEKKDTDDQNNNNGSFQFISTVVSVASIPLNLAKTTVLREPTEDGEAGDVEKEIAEIREEYANSDMTIEEFEEKIGPLVAEKEGVDCSSDTTTDTDMEVDAELEDELSELEISTE